MLKDLKHRSPLILAVLLGLGLAPWAISSMRSPAGGDGLSVLDAAGGFTSTLLLLLVTTIPVALLALLAALRSTPSMAIATFAGGWTVLAWAGGPIDGWLLRHRLPQGYLALLLELVVWLALWVGVAAGALRLRRRLGGAHEDAWPQIPPSRRDVPAAALATVLAASLAILLIQSTRNGQVIGGLIVAFSIATAAAALTWPRAHPLAYFITPFLVPMLAYTLVLLRFDDKPALLAAWFDRSAPGIARVSGPALALPCHYASAAMLGCALGLAWARGLTHRQTSEVSNDTAI